MKKISTTRIHKGETIKATILTPTMVTPDNRSKCVAYIHDPWTNNEGRQFGGRLSLLDIAPKAKQTLNLDACVGATINIREYGDNKYYEYAVEVTPEVHYEDDLVPQWLKREMDEEGIDDLFGVLRNQIANY